MADTTIERAIFERKYDGMAAKEAVSRKMLAEVFWLKRAEIAERDQKELRDSLVNVLALARIKFGNLDAGANEVFSTAEAVLENHSNEVVA